MSTTNSVDGLRHTDEQLLVHVELLLGTRPRHLNSGLVRQFRQTRLRPALPAHRVHASHGRRLDSYGFGRVTLCMAVHGVFVHVDARSLHVAEGVVQRVG